MYSLERVGYEVARGELRAYRLQALENINMYEDGIFEMSHYQPKDSGLPYSLWFDDLGKSRVNNRRVPRVKVMMPTNDLIPFSLEQQPEILLTGVRLTKAKKQLDGWDMEATLNFISVNHKLILRHWYGDIGTFELFKNLMAK